MLRRLLPATKLVARRWKSGASPVAAYAAEDVVKSDHCDVIDGGPVGPYRLRRPLKLPKDHRGVEVIQDPLYNKGMAFDYGERDRLGLRGLMPPCVSTLEEQCMKTMVHLRGLPDDLSKQSCSSWTSTTATRRSSTASSSATSASSRR